MAATLAKGLPYLFVHEADEKKGGAPLATLKLELQDEAQREKLFDDRRVTQWHRKSEFQMISLVEIAEDMLKHSPKYQGQAGFSLYMPGSVHERKLTFRTPVLLYASSNNPGAEAAASELLEQFKDFHVTSEPPKLTSLHHTQAPLKRFQLAALGQSRKQLSHAAATEIEVVSSSAPDELGGTAKPAAEPASPAKETSFSMRSSKSPLPPEEPTHFLLYLTKKTFMGLKGKGLAHEVREARAAGLAVVLVHETDADRDGCAFDTMFKTTPQDLINGGLYDELAELFVSGTTHRKLSHAQLAKKLGAEAGSVRRLSGGVSSAAEMSFSSMRRTSKSGPAGGSGNTSPQAQRGVLEVVQQRA